MNKYITSNYKYKYFQGAYNSEKAGKPGKLQKKFKSGKLRETWEILNLVRGIFVSMIVGIEFCA